MHYQLQIAYRKESRIADADRELDILQGLEGQAAGPRSRSGAKRTKSVI